MFGVSVVAILLAKWDLKKRKQLSAEEVAKRAEEFERQQAEVEPFEVRLARYEEFLKKRKESAHPKTLKSIYDH